ncbi:MAG: hypothetical protein IIC33_05885 [Chloroflexi bacterium]|nr:hypothetical protein [Chloroflexota bacterium]
MAELTSALVGLEAAGVVEMSQAGRCLATTISQPREKRFVWPTISQGVHFQGGTINMSTYRKLTRKNVLCVVFVVSAGDAATLGPVSGTGQAMRLSPDQQVEREVTPRRGPPTYPNALGKASGTASE